MPRGRVPMWQSRYATGDGMPHAQAKAAMLHRRLGHAELAFGRLGLPAQAACTTPASRSVRMKEHIMYAASDLHPLFASDC